MDYSGRDGALYDRFLGSVCEENLLCDLVRQLEGVRGSYEGHAVVHESQKLLLLFRGDALSSFRTNTLCHLFFRF